jgi:hypothetical protein
MPVIWAMPGREGGREGGREREKKEKGSYRNVFQDLRAV